MLHKGEFIIVADLDLCDMYCAQVEKDQQNEVKQNTLVRVLYMLRYPMQHAVFWKDVANENSPLKRGELARLSFIRRCNPCEENAMTYDDSFTVAIKQAVIDAATDGERAILERHLRGIFGKLRAMIRH